LRKLVRKLLTSLMTQYKENSMKALVIGAGIGGLSAAVALKNAGITCEVFEAVKEIKPVGAAISIWPNGVKCMNNLGMGEIIETYGGPMHFLAYKEYQGGETLTRFSLAPLVERTGGRPCPVSRSELQRDARFLGTRGGAVW
jgi:FAD-dependent urate hydroxylase